MSFNAAALQLMLDKGLSLGDVVEIASANEKRADPTATERKRRQRAKEQSERDMSQRDVTRDKGSNDRDILTSKISETSEPKGSSSKATKSFRLPSDWQPQPLAGKALAMVTAWQAGAMERELAKFKNYWLSKGANAARTDWQRTWVNWLISADERTPRTTNERSSNPTAEAVHRILGSC